VAFPSRQDDARNLLRYYGLRPGTEDSLWDQLDTVYFMQHDAEEIAWHTRMLSIPRRPADEPVVKARLSHHRRRPAGDGLHEGPA
jgi:[protein-PII] uridylyltransferase